SLLALDYEKDDYNTPRIAGVVAENEAYIGTVRHDALLVKAVDEPTLVATYEENSPTPYEFEADDAVSAATAVYEADYEHAVCAAGVEVDADGATYAIKNGK
ncbi:MAG: IMP cyclohydrolase, partial [Halohasta sp.]